MNHEALQQFRSSRALDLATEIARETVPIPENRDEISLGILLALITIAERMPHA